MSNRPTPYVIRIDMIFNVAWTPTATQFANIHNEGPDDFMDDLGRDLASNAGTIAKCGCLYVRTHGESQVVARFAISIDVKLSGLDADQAVENMPDPLAEVSTKAALLLGPTMILAFDSEVISVEVDQSYAEELSDYDKTTIY